MSSTTDSLDTQTTTRLLLVSNYYYKTTTQVQTTMKFITLLLLLQSSVAAIPMGFGDLISDSIVFSEKVSHGMNLLSAATKGKKIHQKIL